MLNATAQRVLLLLSILIALAAGLAAGMGIADPQIYRPMTP